MLKASGTTDRTIPYFMWLIVATLLSVALEAGPAQSQPTTENPVPVQMIFWEKQNWEPGGPSERLTLWADGRSEITVKQSGKPKKPKVKWSVREEKPYTIYTKVLPYSTDEASLKFSAAIAAGISELRTFSPDYADGSGTLVGLSVNGKLTQTVIPMFLHDGQQDNKGSENEKKFLAIDAILGKFDTDATEQ
jgi:hypothetical protein